MRNGFTLIELLITIGIIIIFSSAVIPSYRLYQIRSNLNITEQQTVQSLRRAQLLSQSGKESSQWGFRADEGILFLGTDFASRDATYDEHIAVPEGVTVSGVLEVTYSRVYGIPSVEGDIVLTALNGDEKRITINKESTLREVAHSSASSQQSSLSSSTYSAGSSSSCKSHWWKNKCQDSDDDDNDDE